MGINMTDDRRCGTCKFWDRVVIGLTRWRYCDAPVPQWVLSRTNSQTHEKTGTTCPTWSKRDE